jgi:hypothetical protein
LTNRASCKVSRWCGVGGDRRTIREPKTLLHESEAREIRREEKAMVSFNVSKKDHQTIMLIAERVRDAGIVYEWRELIMDLSAVHANGCPMDFPGLLSADRFDFAHDITGIAKHIDRRTGRLMDCFCQRYAMPFRNSAAV